MPQKISFQELTKHGLGVLGNCDHHAPDVRSIINSLVGNVLLHSDKKGGQPEIYTAEYKAPTMVERGKNVIWCYIKGIRYCFTYDHAAHRIVIRKGSLQGAPQFSADNSTPTSMIDQWFEALDPVPVL